MGENNILKRVTEWMNGDAEKQNRVADEAHEENDEAILDRRSAPGFAACSLPALAVGVLVDSSGFQPVSV